MTGNAHCQGGRRRRFPPCTRRLAGLTGIRFIKPPRRAGKRFGLLINFHVALIKRGITRIVNGLEDDHAKSPGRKEAQVYLVMVFLGFQEGALGYL